MGLFERVQQQARTRSAPIVKALADEAQTYGATSTWWGEKPNQPDIYGTYMGVNSVFACVDLRASNLAGLPIQLFRGKGEAEQEVTSGPARELLDRVNPFWTFRRLIYTTEMDLCLWGEAFWMVEKNGAGIPQEIWRTKPTRVTIVPSATDYIAGYLYHPAGGGDPIPFARDEVIWFRYPNPNDEYAGLSPLAAARLGADVATSAMASNRRMFDQGVQLAGVVMPKEGQFSTEQADELGRMLDRRFAGLDRAHRWGVFRSEVHMEPLGFSPKDAQYVETLAAGLEDVARVYKIAGELVGGGKSTYENFTQALRGLWILCLRPEGAFLADEITEQLLPMFGSMAPDRAVFDFSQVEALQDDKGLLWDRATKAFAVGALGEKAWHQTVGVEYDPADRRKMQLPGIGETLVPLASETPITAPTVDVEPAGETPTERLARLWARLEQATLAEPAVRTLDYGSDAHRVAADAFSRRITQDEQDIADLVRSLFAEQLEEVVQRLNQQLRALPADREPFDLEYWIREFRRRGQPVLREIYRRAGVEALIALGAAGAFDLDTAASIRFLASRAQRFAQHVNETTWRMLKAEISEALAAGESIPDIERRVRKLMGSRIQSSAETIARTETLGAANGGTLDAWRQSGVVRKKAWLASLDGRERDDHRAAHSRYQQEPIGLDQNFTVGGATGPGPGMLGAADQDVNCRCTVVPIVDDRERANGNGHKTLVTA